MCYTFHLHFICHHTLTRHHKCHLYDYNTKLCPHTGSLPETIDFPLNYSGYCTPQCGDQMRPILSQSTSNIISGNIEAPMAPIGMSALTWPEKESVSVAPASIGSISLIAPIAPMAPQASLERPSQSQNQDQEMSLPQLDNMEGVDLGDGLEASLRYDNWLDVDANEDTLFGLFDIRNY